MKQIPLLRAFLMCALLLGGGWLIWNWITHASPDKLVADLMAQAGIPGAVIAYGPALGPMQIKAIGWQDHAHTRPMEADRPFKIASLTKPVTAAAISELVAQGKLSYDTRLLDLFEDHGTPLDERFHLIRIKHLLEHSAGWNRDQTFDPFFRSEAVLRSGYAFASIDLKDCTGLAKASLILPLQFTPGTGYAYSNLGYCWLGMVIEKQTGQPLEQALAHLVPEAQAMTFKEPPNLIEPHIPEGQADLLVNRPEVIGPAGGLMTTAKAYYAFAKRPVRLQDWEQPGYIKTYEFYGPGWRIWMIDDGLTLSHYGAMPGVFSLVMKKPNGPVFVAFFNARPPDDIQLYKALFEGVRALSFWR